MVVNGRACALPEPAFVEDALRRMGFDPARVAVLLNGEVVPRGRLADTRVREGDALEVVAFVGGG